MAVQKYKSNMKKIELMKRITLLTLLLLLISTSIQAQGFFIKKVFENETLEEILRVIESESDYQFSYSSTSIPITMKLSVSLNDSSIETALSKIFSGTAIDFEVINKRIILRQSREGQTLRGKVIDSYTKIPIIGASVIIIDSNPLKGDATNQDGNFRIEQVLPGRYNLKISYLGYQDNILSGVLVGAGQEVILEIELTESLLQLDEIQVGVKSLSAAPLNEMAQVSGRSFTVEETKRFPVSVGDPLRLASSFAGVLATDDGANDIVVRGNSPKGILWRLEGVEIPSPNHFSEEGSSAGGISMFSTQVISRSDFLTSAFPAQYGNATASVFDIQLRNGNNEKRQSTLQFGLLGIDVASEGPLEKGGKSSYLFNYRYSTLSILTELGLDIEGEGERNIFQDLSFKFNFPTEKAGTFSLFGMGGLSSYRASLESIEDEEIYNMGVIGLSNKYIINNDAVLRTTLSWSGTNIQDNFKFGDIGNEYENYSTFKKGYFRLGVDLDNKINPKNFISTGFTASLLSYDFQEQIKIPYNTPPLDDFIQFNDVGNSGSFQSYVSWKYKPSENLSFVNGIHLLHFFLNKETAIEPRSNVRWQFHPKTAMFAGFGLHSRIESLDYYFANSIQPDGSTLDLNSNLGITRSSHFVAGFDNQLSPNTYMKAEFYYQRIFNVPILADTVYQGSAEADAFSTINISSGYVVENLQNGGRGWNYGAELTIERQFEGDYFFMFTGMLYESKYQGRDGITRNTRYNGNFGYNLLAGKEFRVGNNKENILGLNLKLTHAGNKRYSPIDIELSRQDGTAVSLAKDTFTQRFPDYFRTDVQISFRRNRNNLTSEWRLDIQNLTSHNNVLDVFYDPSTDQIFFPEEKIFIPVLSYRLEF